MVKKIIIILFIPFLLFAEVNGAKLLIIVADVFYNAVLPLAKWKHKKGFPTKVVKVSQIGNSPSAIKSYIQDAYSNWEIKPEYVLLVGAVEHLATEPKQAYDHYYSDINGDVLPDIAVGRLPCLVDPEVPDTQAKIMVYKILAFEKEPLLIPDWYIWVLIGWKRRVGDIGKKGILLILGSQQ